MPDGSADPQRQVTVMNARVAELVAGGTDRMALAGDQLYIDLDLSVGNLPAGSLLAVGHAVLQVSDAPHLGCAKFVERFGAEAMRFVNSGLGRQLRLRGMNARVVQPGIVRPGDIATRPHMTARQPGELPAFRLYGEEIARTRSPMSSGPHDGRRQVPLARPAGTSGSQVESTDQARQSGEH
jgi:MOSC domain-containing protein YiiM